MHEQNTYTHAHFLTKSFKPILLSNMFFFFSFHGKHFGNCNLVPDSDSNGGWTFCLGAGGLPSFLMISN